MQVVKSDSTVSFKARGGKGNNDIKTFAIFSDQDVFGAALESLQTSVKDTANNATP